MLGIEWRSRHGRQARPAAKIGAMVESATTDMKRLAPNRAKAMPPAMNA